MLSPLLVLEELMTYHALKCNAILLAIKNTIFDSPKPGDEEAARKWMKEHEDIFSRSIA